MGANELTRFFMDVHVIYSLHVQETSTFLDLHVIQMDIS